MELRRRFGLESVPIEENNAAAIASAQATSEAADAAEKKIAELRLRLQAVRAPYEASEHATATATSSQISSSAPASVTAPATVATAALAPSTNSDAQAQLAAIRERLARFQQSAK